MQKSKAMTSRDTPIADPAALAAEYLRLFAHHLPVFGDFDDFMEGLERLVEKDSYLLGSAKLGEDPGGRAALPDFEQLGKDETVVSVSGSAGNQGYIKYAGKSDGSAFGAGDLHLMGAIAGFVSVLSCRAHAFKENGRAAKVLQYLINQLPLGVVCFGADGALIVQSKLATRLLGDAGKSPLVSVMTDGDRFKQGREQFHLEVEGKFIYAEGRKLEIDEHLIVTAFVLYDLSKHTAKLTGDLEREAFRSESRGAPLTLAVLQSSPDGKPGALYQGLRNCADGLNVPPSAIYPIDAFSCACLFSGVPLREARLKLIQANLQNLQVINVSVQQHEDGQGNEHPGQMLLENTQRTIDPLELALLPRVLVLDPYPAVCETLNVAAAEACRADPVCTVSDTLKNIESGIYEGLVISLDDYDVESLAMVTEVVQSMDGAFKLFYTSFKQPAVVRGQYGLDPAAILFQKPFHADTLVERLKQEFNLS